jgi:hypothetical protein
VQGRSSHSQDVVASAGMQCRDVVQGVVQGVVQDVVQGCSAGRSARRSAGT